MLLTPLCYKPMLQTPLCNASKQTPACRRLCCRCQCATRQCCRCCCAEARAADAKVPRCKADANVPQANASAICVPQTKAAVAGAQQAKALQTPQCHAEKPNQRADARAAEAGVLKAKADQREPFTYKLVLCSSSEAFTTTLPCIPMCCMTVHPLVVLYRIRV